MKAIESKFNSEFVHWKIRLPKEDVARRRRGIVTKGGWVILYLFGSDQRGEYLDYYASHRMSDDRHVRVYANGEVEELPSIRTFREVSLDPEEDKRLDAEYLAENARIAQLLEQKGFGITGEEPVLINRALQTNAFSQGETRGITAKDEVDKAPSLPSEVSKLRDFIEHLQGFQLHAAAEGGFDRMGATLADAVLQAGINYEKVVRPRVDRIRATHPEARTTTGFDSALRGIGAPKLLDWAAGKKTRTLEALGVLLVTSRVESEADLKVWMMSNPNSIEQLKAIKGIGDKTVDYLKILCGLDSNAVDRHVRSFVAMAGIPPLSYDHVKSLITLTSEAMSGPGSLLD